MNTKRTYLDSLNAGRQRRSYATLDQLNRSLDTLGHDRLGGDRPYGNMQEREAREAYSAIARDIERVRGQEDGLAEFGKIAGELRGLRDELRHQTTAAIRREFDALRQDLERGRAEGAGNAAGQLGVEFDRLSDAIEALAGRSDDRTLNQLKLEIEQLHSAMGSMAREESVMALDQRWDDLDQRFASLEKKVSSAPAAGSVDMSPIVRHLEEIGAALARLPESVSPRSLDDKIRTLATALDQFIGQHGIRTTETLVQIEERLEEIARALVATTVAVQQPNVDPEPFQRIEARISALSKQIEEFAQERPAVVTERLDTLTARLDDIARRADAPEQAIDRLAQQVSAIADRIEKTVDAPAGQEMILEGIGKRFDELTEMIERRQDDTVEQGSMMLNELARRIDEFVGLAGREADATIGPADDKALRGLEARLDDISGRLDASAGQYPAIDPDLIRNLELQVASLSAHLSRPSSPLPEFEDLVPRLADIERSIAESREGVMEAARAAADHAVRALTSTQAESAVVAALAQDLKALESLARRSDERNGKTFEAIHDTLLKIVDRLASIEVEARASSAAPERPHPFAALPVAEMAAPKTPAVEPEIAGAKKFKTSVERSPAQAAAAAAFAALDSNHAVEAPKQVVQKRSMLGGLTSLLSKKSKKDTPPAEPEAPSVAVPLAAVEPTPTPVPSVDLDAPLDPRLANRPLEPGSGAPDLNAIMKRVRDERGQPARPADSSASKSDFIAAARRAAQAAAAEADALKRKSDIGGPVRALRIGDLIKSRRKPLLMGTAAIMTALAGLQVGKSFMSDPTELAAGNTASPVVAAKPPAAPASAAIPVEKIAAAPLETDEAASGRHAVAAAQPQAGASGVEIKMLPSRTTAPEPAADTIDLSGGTLGPSLLDRTGSTEISAEPVAMTGVEVAALTTSPAADETPAVIEVPVEAGPVALREAASAGDPRALFEIATRYADGVGVKANTTVAAMWYEKAAELDFAPAEYRIGSFYEKGTGVARDIAKSKEWYLKAAESGNASAMHNLAVLYAMGAAGSADNEAAARWFIAAAELGVRDSQFNLGILTAKGVGTPQNLEESYKWFALVAKAGDKDAEAKRDEIAKALRPEQLERARAAAELWKPKPLDQQANTVDIPDSWRASAETTASIDRETAIRNIQMLLNKSGYDAGKPDGRMGTKTRSAIAAFQKANGMDATGQVDEKLVQVLLQQT